MTGDEEISSIELHNIHKTSYFCVEKKRHAWLNHSLVSARTDAYLLLRIYKFFRLFFQLILLHNAFNQNMFFFSFQ